MLQIRACLWQYYRYAHDYGNATDTHICLWQCYRYAHGCGNATDTRMFVAMLQIRALHG